jgi:hypothetical protein
MVSSKVQRSYFRLAVAGILFSSIYINKVISFKVWWSVRDFSFISLLTTMGVLILF